MPKKPRFKPDRKVIRKIFPPEMVRELDTIIEEIDNPRERRSNPSGKVIRKRHLLNTGKA